MLASGLILRRNNKLFKMISITKPSVFTEEGNIEHLRHSSSQSSSQSSMALLKVKKLTDNAFVPTRGSSLAAGYDLYAAYDCVVPARGKAMVKTDIATAIPNGYYGRVAPRSGLAWKHSIDVGAGVIDEDYRGNIGVILFNHCDEVFNITRGDRIAQLILEKIITPEVVVVDELDETNRNENGFGSTGVKLKNDQ